ncbi:MAG: DsbE family thiol:disulfide interchange protein [Parvularculaceae bacterium]
MKRVLFAAPLIAFASIVAAFAVGLRRDPSYAPSMLIDRPAPAFDLPASEGRGGTGFSSLDLAGGVSLVNVFGSWCVSCAVEHPVLLRIEAEGLAPIHGLNWKDPPGAGAAWLARHGDPYALVGDDAAGRVAIDYGVTGAPETFVVDAAGRIRHKHVGPIDEQTWEGVLKPMIEDLKRASAS